MKSFSFTQFLIVLACAFAMGDWSSANEVPRVAIIYSGGESVGPAEIRRAAAVITGKVGLSIFAPGSGGDAFTAETDLSSFDVVFIDGSTDGLEKSHQQIQTAKSRTKVVIVTPLSSERTQDNPTSNISSTDRSASLEGNVSLVDHPSLERYYRNPSQKNYAALIQYLLVEVGGRKEFVAAGQTIPSPIIYPQCLYYHPDAPAPHFFVTLSDYLDWQQTRTQLTSDGNQEKASNILTLGLYSHLTQFQQENMAHVDAIIRATERQGSSIIPLLGRGDPALAELFTRDNRVIIDVLLFGGERLHLKGNDSGIAEARKLGVPIVHMLNHHKMTADEFAASPNGLHPDLTAHLVNTERTGVIEPLVVSVKGAPRGARHAIAPLLSQVEWRVRRAVAWARLHRAANQSKRVVFTYWSEGAGKANVGGDPDDFLDVQGSLVRILTEMKLQGYDVGSDPVPDRDWFANRMANQASNVGSWAPGELAERVRTAEVALLPEETYRDWFDALPAARRAEIVEMWGPPPGEVMVYTDPKGKRFIVIPKIQLGNVLIAPHPDWGYLQSNKSLMSTGALPPHHQYLAFFLWLQRDFKADAWVSMFSNLVLQGGKSEGPVVDDHIGIMLGAIPQIHPERLGANGGVAMKRKGLAQTVGWYNHVVPADGVEQLFELRARIARYLSQPDEKLRSDAEPLIREEAKRTGIDRAIAPIDVDTAAFPELLTSINTFLVDLDRSHAPHGSKILGDAPSGAALSDMVTSMLGSELRKSLETMTETPYVAARSLVAAVLLEGRSLSDALSIHVGKTSPDAEAQLALANTYANLLRTAPREIDAILEALAGKYIEPGPMEEPIRDPDSLPPGRSLYNFDQDAIPTPEAESIGIRQAEALISAHREKNNGDFPNKLAFVIWSSEIAKNHGVTEAQILHLLGTRVVRDVRGHVTGVELIPRETLGRPRVDVLITTSGTYRDHYQDKVELIAAAVKLATESAEADNPVSASTRESIELMLASGESRDRASKLALARVFSPAPGAYSPSIQFLAKSGDHRGDESRMAELFTNRMSHAYGGGFSGESARPAFEQNLGKVDAATLPRSSNVNGLLDHPMSAGFLGGLNLSAKAVQGKDIDLYVSNLRDKENVSMELASRALQNELRSRYFNPKWLKEMQAHGYDGARTMMLMTDHLDLWDLTATKMVSSADWSEVKSVYVDDKLKLNMNEFFEKYNPHSQQVLLANLLGAASRGHWQATQEELSQVANKLAQSVTTHGAVCEAGICRNDSLTSEIAKAIGDSPEAKELMVGYRRTIEKVTETIETDAAPDAGSVIANATAADSSEPATNPEANVDQSAPASSESSASSKTEVPVTGQLLEEKTITASQATNRSELPWFWIGLSTSAIVLIAAGWFLGRSA